MTAGWRYMKEENDMHFVMTQEDIDGAIRRDSRNCAVARVIRRQLGRRLIDVLPDCIAIGNDIHDTPANVAAFIDAYDDGLTPEPIEFDLPI